MKATGVVRRIDDLGRIVIPKEIRRTLRIKEGDPQFGYSGSSRIFYKMERNPATASGTGFIYKAAGYKTESHCHYLY